MTYATFSKISRSSISRFVLSPFPLYFVGLSIYLWAWDSDTPKNLARARTVLNSYLLFKTILGQSIFRGDWLYWMMHWCDILQIINRQSGGYYDVNESIHIDATAFQTVKGKMHSLRSPLTVWNPRSFPHLRDGKQNTKYGLSITPVIILRGPLSIIAGLFRPPPVPQSWGRRVPESKCMNRNLTFL